jgi:hypothetical protein
MNKDDIDREDRLVRELSRQVMFNRIVGILMGLAMAGLALAHLLSR